MITSAGHMAEYWNRRINRFVKEMRESGWTVKISHVEGSPLRMVVNMDMVRQFEEEVPE